MGTGAPTGHTDEWVDADHADEAEGRGTLQKAVRLLLADPDLFGNCRSGMLRFAKQYSPTKQKKKESAPFRIFRVVRVQPSVIVASPALQPFLTETSGLKATASFK